MASPALADRDKVVVRATASRKGRHISVTPGTTATTHLSYGRIRLDRETPSVTFAAGGDEVGLICLSGEATVTLGPNKYPMGRFDALYVPRDSTIGVETKGEVDIAEIRAPVDGHYPTQHVRYAEVKANPGLSFRAGGPASSRTLNILLGKNIEAGRIVAGVTWSDPGHWTSWPPHEHAALLEEMYVFFDMPAPSFAIQMVYTDPNAPERVEVVHDGDAVIMPVGFHPMVSIPGYPVSFIWIMAAKREREDRLFGVVNVQPGFDQAPSGLEAGRK